MSGRMQISNSSSHRHPLMQQVSQPYEPPGTNTTIVHHTGGESTDDMSYDSYSSQHGSSHGSSHYPGGVQASHSAHTTTHHPAQSYNNTYSNCFGLPYQDHNYGAPPPITPPPPVNPMIQSPYNTMVVGNQGSTNHIPSNIPKIPGTIASLASKSATYNGHIDIENVLSTTEVVTTGQGLNTSSSSSTSVDSSSLAEAASPTQYTAEDGVTRCICDYQHDDGYMICCDQCCVWQHVDCMEIDRNDIPDNYLCEKCDVRSVDKHNAVALQRRKRQEIPGLAGSSSTETENETLQRPLLQDRKKKVKKQLQRERDRANKLMKKSKKGKHLNLSALRTGEKMRKQKINNNSTLKRKMNSPKRSPIKTRALRLATQSPQAKKILMNGDEVFSDHDGNEYSQELQDLLSSKRSNGNQYHDDDMDDSQDAPLDQLLSVRHLANNQKVLEVLEDVPCDQLLAEFTGKIMLRNEFNKENIVSKRGQKYVLFYSKFSETDLCVDATASTNVSRFVRRSCTPNSEIRHVILDERKIKFYIFTLRSVSKGTEITIPFDYDYMDGNFTNDCACTKSNCPVFKARDAELSPRSPHKQPRMLRMRSVPGKLSTNNKLKEQKLKDQKLKEQKLKKTLKNRKRKLSELSPVKVSPPPVKIEKQKVSSPTKVAKSPRRLSECSPQTSPVALPHKSPHRSNSVSTNSNNNASSLSSSLSSPGPASPRASHRSMSTSAVSSSNTEEEPPPEPNKKLTREERKMEAIMKAFEKMAKREERKKEASKVGTPRRTTTDEDVIDTSEADSQKEEVKMEKKEVAEPKKEEVEKTPVTRRGRKKSKSGTAAARRRRVSSTTSGPRSDIDLASSCDESAIPVVPATPTGATTTTPYHKDSVSTPVTPSIGMGPGSGAFRFHKTKKHLMNEWLNENESNNSNELSRPLRIRTESCDSAITTSSSVAAPTICPPPTIEEEDSMPSPQALPQHRRNSTSVVTSSCTSSPGLSSLGGNTSLGGSLGGSSAIKHFTAAQLNTPQDPGFGSAKKRWLRQAMFERTDPEPSASQSSSTEVDVTSPGTSPLDFVTPLKKRRLARSSISLEHSPSIASSTSTAPSTPLSGSITGGPTATSTPLGFPGASFMGTDSGMPSSSSSLSSSMVPSNSQDIKCEPCVTSQQTVNTDVKCEAKCEVKVEPSEGDTTGVTTGVVAGDGGGGSCKMEVDSSQSSIPTISQSLQSIIDCKTENKVFNDSGIKTDSSAIKYECSQSDDFTDSAITSDSPRAHSTVSQSPLAHSTVSRSPLAHSTASHSVSQSSDSGLLEFASDAGCELASSSINSTDDLTSRSKLVHPNREQSDSTTSTTNNDYGPRTPPTPETYELEEGEYVSGDEGHQGAPQSTVSSQHRQQGDSEMGGGGSEQKCDSASSVVHNMGSIHSSTQSVSCSDSHPGSSNSHGTSPDTTRRRTSSEQNIPEISSTDNLLSSRPDGLCDSYVDSTSSYSHVDVSSTSTRTLNCGVSGGCVSGGIGGLVDSPSSTVHHSTWMLENSDISSSSSNNCQQEPATKKKVSLLEYRKRMKARTPSGPSSSEKKTTSTVTVQKSTKAARQKQTKKSSTPTLAPLPLFESHEKEEADVPWNTAATTVERIREQSGLSLTERLKREFGVDASESDDEAKNNGDEIPPPPPPPPQGGTNSTPTSSGTTTPSGVTSSTQPAAAVPSGVTQGNTSGPISSTSTLQSQLQSTIQSLQQTVAQTAVKQAAVKQQQQQAKQPAVKQQSANKQQALLARQGPTTLAPLNSLNNRATSPTPLPSKMPSQQFVEALTQLAAHTSSLVNNQNNKNNHQNSHQNTHQNNHLKTAYKKQKSTGMFSGSGDKVINKSNSKPPRRCETPPPPPPPRRHSYTQNTTPSAPHSGPLSAPPGAPLTNNKHINYSATNGGTPPGGVGGVSRSQPTAAPLGPPTASTFNYNHGYPAAARHNTKTKYAGYQMME